MGEPAARVADMHTCPMVTTTAAVARTGSAKVEVFDAPPLDGASLAPVARRR